MVKSNKPYRLGLYEKSIPNSYTLKEKLEICKETGFDYLEMSIDESDWRQARLDWTEEEILELRHAMEETGVSIDSICLSGHRKYPFGSHDEATRARSLVIMEKAIVLAHKLGIRLIQLAGYDVYYEEGDEDTRKWFLENLTKASEMAAYYGVNLGFETMETPFMDTVEKSMAYVSRVNNPYLGVYPDIGNLKNASLIYGNTVNDDLKLGKGHIFASHLKETVPGKYREIPFGTGHTEFVSNIQVLKELGVRMFVGEFWDVGNPTWKEDMEFASKFLRGKLDEGFKA